VKLIERVKNIVDPELDSMGFELIKIDLYSRGRSKIVRLYIDNPLIPVSINDCIKVTRALELVLEAERVFDASYNLEVSSPGINRPLSKPEHFIRFKGRRVKLSVIREDGKRRGYVGIVSEAGENGFTLTSGAKEISISYGDIKEANLYGEKWKVPKRKNRGTVKGKGNIFDSSELVN
jgi:ribosome maturation factor RimP